MKAPASIVWTERNHRSTSHGDFCPVCLWASGSPSAGWGVGSQHLSALSSRPSAHCHAAPPCVPTPPHTREFSSPFLLASGQPPGSGLPTQGWWRGQSASAGWGWAKKHRLVQMSGRHEDQQIWSTWCAPLGSTLVCFTHLKAFQLLLQLSAILLVTLSQFLLFLSLCSLFLCLHLHLIADTNMLQSHSNTCIIQVLTREHFASVGFQTICKYLTAQETQCCPKRKF